MTSGKRAAVQRKYRALTKPQLKAVVADYAAAFPDWSLVHDGFAFVRRFGPVEQKIWFQKMSGGSYRPSHVINTTALLQPAMLHQILDIKHREVDYLWHERKFADTLRAMEQQFRPDIRKPLDIAEVLSLCKAEAWCIPDTTNNMAMLAILYAWLGHKAKALNCCERLQCCPLPEQPPIPEWEVAKRAFGRDLAKAVEAGKAREFLEAAAGRAKAT